MRASKAVRSRKSKEIHISGAEGIYEESEISGIGNEYIKRALNHPRGKPDTIHITIEKIKTKPKRISLLPVKTLKSDFPSEAKEIISKRLSGMAISKEAIRNAFKVLRSRETMRGAALIFSESGKRSEPDRERGVRVSRFGIEKSAGQRLSRSLLKIGINTDTVKEAVMLASKVAACPDIIAEVCISDDPDYTTGYIASRKSGYLRIPNIKNKGEMHGGRVFFIRENKDIGSLINYLEKIPAVVK